MQTNTLLRLSALGCIALTLTGCSFQIGEIATKSAAPTGGSGFQGNVHGGQQPVTGATIQLYAVNSAGYGASSLTLLTVAAVTDSSGNFKITGNYTCPTASTPVYVTATGGNPGLSAVNSNIALMSAIGACGNLTSSSFITINELTTVTSVYALSPFMSNYASISSSAANTQGLFNAFNVANELVNTSTGLMPGATLPAAAVEPTSKLNSLADIMAACINSAGGIAGDGSACGIFFTNTTPPGGTPPTNTINALLNVAKNPGRNVSTLLSLITPGAPFQPTLAAATDFTVAVKYKTGGFSTPSASAVDSSGNLWVTNSASSTVSVISPTGTPIVGSPYSGGGLSAPSGIAFDAGGNAWVTDKSSSQLTVLTSSGGATLTSATGLSTPTAVAIDGQGLIWVTNSGNSSVTAVTASGTTVTASSSYPGVAGVKTPVALAINPQ